MPIYIRTYRDFSYELIHSEGRVKKKRLHILVNPGNLIKLKGQAQKLETEVNSESLTHIVAMETSVHDPKMANRTVKLAELTNKPIITNDETAKLFKNKGLSVKQLRILGFAEEIIDGLQIDPVYIEELEESSELKNDTKLSFYSKVADLGKMMTSSINPLKWKSMDKIKGTISEDLVKREVDPSKPLAIFIKFNKFDTVLIPLDERAMKNINRLISNMQPKITILPNSTVSDTLNLDKGSNTILVLNETHLNEQVINIPKTHNPHLPHDTIYGGFEEWIQIL